LFFLINFAALEKLVKVLLQRVTQASVIIGEERVSRIGRGLVVLVGVAKGDTEKDARYLVEKTVNLRIFPDDEGKLNLSLLDINGELLAVSQFTLLADTRKGRRPSFIQAALPGEAEDLFNSFVEMAKATGLKVATGRFQQHMLVEIYNDGPVTILLDSKL
jgi:D-tyrosyl-tRNA(Tyr) deacylase